jgi:hypothetical protein
VHRDSAATASAAVWRRMVLACVIAYAVGAVVAPGAVADRSITPSPDELWRAYPVEQTPTRAVDTPGSRPASRSSTGRSVSRAQEDESPGNGPPWIACLAAAGAGAVVFLTARAVRSKLLLSRRGVRRSRNAEARTPGRLREAQLPVAAAQPITAESAARRVTDGHPPSSAERQGDLAQSRPAAPTTTGRPPLAAGADPPRVSPTNVDRKLGAGRAVAPSAPSVPPLATTPRVEPGRAPGHEFADHAVSPGRRFERGIGGAEQQKGRTTEARNQPVCQIRWMRGRRGSCFYAAMTDTDEIERALAWSPRFGWRGPSPPEQSAEAQAALRQLAKELRKNGWRPLRAKGEDVDEQRWYARRFRQPGTEDEGNDEGRTSVGIGEVVHEAGGELGRRSQR